MADRMDTRTAARLSMGAACRTLVRMSASPAGGVACTTAPCPSTRTGDIVLHHRTIDELEIGRLVYGRRDRLGVCPRGRDRGLDICAESWGDLDHLCRRIHAARRSGAVAAHPTALLARHREQEIESWPASAGELALNQPALAR